MRSPVEELPQQFTELGHASEAAFFTLLADGADQREIDVSRYSARVDGLSCERAVAVSDEWHNQGLGTACATLLSSVLMLRTRPGPIHIIPVRPHATKYTFEQSRIRL